MLLAACSKKEEKKAATPPPAQKESSSSSSGNPISAPVDYLGAVAKAKKTAGGTVNMASVNQAIQMFRVEENRNPNTLDELVSKGYLPRLPAPPNGMKFAYDPRSGQIRLTR